MKKLILAAAVIGLAVVSQAASVTWKYTGSSADTGYTVYLYATAVAATYTSFDALTTASIDSAVVTTKKVGPKTTYVTPEVTSGATGITKTSTLYFVLIEDSSATTYKYGSVDVSGKNYVYDPDALEAAGDTLPLTSANFTSTGTIAVPEPTSGLLLFLGVAGLALRRKRI